MLGEADRLGLAVRHDHAAAGHDDREFGAGQGLGRLVQALLAAGRRARRGSAWGW